MIAFDCPGCRHKLRVKDHLAGKKGKCPQCGRSVVVPASLDLATLPPLGGLPSHPGQTGAGVDNTLAPSGGSCPAEFNVILTPPEAPDELGRLGGYRVLHVLGAGGMGVVFRAEDVQLARPVALKAMLPGFAASSQARERFLREARAAAAVKHDHVVTIYQVSDDRGTPFLAMEFLEGQPLDARLRSEGRLSVAEVLRIGREIAEGLAAAHARGLIHRDIKPANVWLEAPRGRVKILDFGLARAASDQQLTQTGAILGTPAFMSPEQTRGQPADYRSDLFSLGSVLYCMATGQLPFKGDDTIATLMAVATETPTPPRGLNPDIPPALADLIDRLLTKDAAHRPASAQDVAHELERIALKRTTAAREATLLSNPSPARQPSPPPARTRRKTASRGRKTALVMGSAAVVLLAGIFALILFRKPPQPRDRHDGLPVSAAGPSAETLAFFNRKNLDGWNGAPGLWQVQHGELLGSTFPDGVQKNTFLFSKKEYRNFDLKCQVRLRGGPKANSGIQFRSRVVDPEKFVVYGPQADIGGSLWGDLFNEGARKDGLWKAASPEAARTVKSDDFNDFALRCVGHHVTILVNGVTAVDDDFPALPDTGIIAWQLHSGPPFELTVRNIEFTELPEQAAFWKPLFNGKDLTGWTHFGTGNWRVEDGALTCSGPRSHLFSDRGDYKNFRVRAEVMINETGNSGLFFRTAFGDQPEQDGYEAQIALPGGDLRYWTGSLYGIVAWKERLHQPDEWFNLYLTCEGDLITIAVNGKITVDVHDSKHGKGHFALQHLRPQTRVRFRSIEVMELSPR